MKILIIGATSAIAEATARRWAAQGHSLFLVARNKEKLDVIVTDLQIRGCPKVGAFILDINQFELHDQMIASATEFLEGFDTVLIAHGTLSNQKVCQESVDLTLEEIKTNALSVIAVLTKISNLFEQQKSGTIGVISSVAGDRVRQSNYVYGSAKAMISAFLSELRQRLHPAGVCVITINPGFIDTPMTKEFKKGLLWSTPEKAAEAIDKAYVKKKNTVYVPKFWKIIMLIIQLIPETLFKRLKI